ncbi:MAG TPA: hypothetical protein VGF97_05200 [Rhizomicrobium sp.]|jgi:hypothetical protein
MVEKQLASHGLSPRGEVDAFLRRADQIPALSEVRGRLIFAVDATMSRQRTWDSASEIQRDMFDVARAIGGIGMQLVFFRGRGEFDASRWTTNPAALAERMSRVSCRSGFTQICRVLKHAADEAGRTNVRTLVLIGDSFEENPQAALDAAGALALRGVRAFLFQEGDNPDATAVFREIARLTGGVHARFDSTSIGRLRDLLRAAAVYAAGGLPALHRYGDGVGGEVQRLMRGLEDHR